MHPADALSGTSSQLLAGRRIVLGITGSIAAVKTVELARELIRHGAEVQAVMSPAATRIVHPNALEFATGRKPVLELTGEVEHVRDLGRGVGKADLFLVAPCTGNTLAKIALGIDDTPVTTYASVGLATTPILIAPAMHDSMHENAFLQERIAALRARGVVVLDPFFEEGKAKLPDPLEIVEHVLRILCGRRLAGKRVLVVTGSTVEPLDEMRVVTNKSTGRTGLALAVAAFRMGADVEMWFGHGHADVPGHIPLKRFVTVDDLLRMAPQAAEFDAVLLPAAISDFGPAPAKGKIPSTESPTIRLAPLPKVVKEIRRHMRGTLVPFKAESGVAEEDLVRRARESVEANAAAFVVANDLRGVQVDASEVLLVDLRTAERVKGSKDDVARAILERLAREMKG